MIMNTAGYESLCKDFNYKVFQQHLTQYGHLRFDKAIAKQVERSTNYIDYDNFYSCLCSI